MIGLYGNKVYVQAFDTPDTHRRQTYPGGIWNRYGIAHTERSTQRKLEIEKQGSLNCYSNPSDKWLESR